LGRLLRQRRRCRRQLRAAAQQGAALPQHEVPGREVDRCDGGLHAADRRLDVSELRAAGSSSDRSSRVGAARSPRGLELPADALQVRELQALLLRELREQVDVAHRRRREHGVGKVGGERAAGCGGCSSDTGSGCRAEPSSPRQLAGRSVPHRVRGGVSACSLNDGRCSSGRRNRGRGRGGACKHLPRAQHALDARGDVAGVRDGDDAIIPVLRAQGILASLRRRQHARRGCSARCQHGELHVNGAESEHDGVNVVKDAVRSAKNTPQTAPPL
jgi:hypothetical protein